MSRLLAPLAVFGAVLVAMAALSGGAASPPALSAGGDLGRPSGDPVRDAQAAVRAAPASATAYAGLGDAYLTAPSQATVPPHPRSSQLLLRSEARASRLSPRGVLAVPLQLADALARLVLARAQLLELRQKRAAALVQLSASSSSAGPAAARQRVTRGLRVLADLPEVEDGDLA